MTKDQLAKLKTHLQTLDGLVTDTTPGATPELLEVNRPRIRAEVKAAREIVEHALAEARESD